MGRIVGWWLLLLACLAGPALAQGVFVPTPGSAPAATGPTSINPSAAPSSTNPSAYNPSAAPSAVATPNAMNPSATPSTFAPQVTGPSPRSVVPSPVVAPRRAARPPGGRPTARARRDAPQETEREGPGRAEQGVSGERRQRDTKSRAPAEDTAPENSATNQTLRRAEQRARGVMGSVCRGC